VENCWIEFAGTQAAVLKREEQVLAVGAGEALIRGELSVISPGTELSMLNDTIVPWPAQPARAYPRYPGYAMVGQVVQSADERRLPVGSRVVAGVPHRRFSVVASSDRISVCRIPDGVADHDAVLAPLAQIALAAPLSLETRLGHRVLVIGLGIIGCLAAQWYRNGPALAVAGTDLDVRRAAFARARGIEILSGEQLSAGAPFDIVVEATGTPAGLEQACRWVRRGGGVIALGTTRGRLDGFDFTNLVHRRSVTLVGAHTSGGGGEIPVGPPRPGVDALELALRYIAADKLDLAGLIGRVASPSDAPAAYAAVAAGEYHTIAFDWSRV
jgi:2-desacetyl-2-hydroxyethyl bacteriochlorophyllide A dehydrogenase